MNYLQDMLGAGPLRTAILLIPLILTLWLIRWREDKEGVPKYSTLENAQKIWLVITSLPPNSSALILETLPLGLWKKCVSASSSLPLGSGKVSGKALEEFLDGYKEALDFATSSETPGLIDGLALRAQNFPGEVADRLCQIWPCQIEEPVQYEVKDNLLGSETDDSCHKETLEETEDKQNTETTDNNLDEQRVDPEITPLS